MFFIDSTAVDPSFTMNQLPDGVTYIFDVTVSTKINSGSNQQEVSCYLNGTFMARNGNYCALASTFKGLCKKGDVIRISAYKNGGSWEYYNTRLVLTPVENY